jgi:hypothetical protein
MTIVDGPKLVLTAMSDKEEYTGAADDDAAIAAWAEGFTTLHADAWCAAWLGTSGALVFPCNLHVLLLPGILGARRRRSPRKNGRRASINLTCDHRCHSYLAARGANVPEVASLRTTRAENETQERHSLWIW